MNEGSSRSSRRERVRRIRINALFSRAETYYREALKLARETGNVAAEGKALTDLIQTLAWWRPAEARRLQPLAVEVNESIANKIELVKLHAATAVAMTNAGGLNAAEDEIEQGLALTDQCGYPGGMIWCWVARAFNKARRADRDGYAAAATRVAAIAADLGGNRFWGQIAQWLASATYDGPSTVTRWLDGEDLARQRWHAIGTSP